MGFWSCRKQAYFISSLYEKFCTSFREHAANVINFEKKKILPLTKTELRLHQDATSYYICGKRFSKKFAKGKNYQKVRDHYHFTCKHREEAHGICNLTLNVPRKIPVFHSGSNNDYHFIIKEWGQYECHREKHRKVQTLFCSNTNIN